MRALFVGTIDFSHFCLKRLIDLPVDIAALVTDTPTQNTFNADYRDLRPLAKAADIPIRTDLKLENPDTSEWVDRLDIEVIFVFGWSRIVPNEVLSAAPLGGLGSHPSPLPVGRGRHPLIWTILKGLKQGGLSFFRLTDKPDAGPVLAQEKFPVTPYDDAGTLYDRMKNAAGSLLPSVVRRLGTDNPGWTKQDEGRATSWEKRGEEDGWIDWTSSSEDIYDLVRALTGPYVGAHTFYDDRRIRIWRTSPPYHETMDPDASAVPPGTVLEASDRWLRVKAGTGAVRVIHWDVGAQPLDITVGVQFHPGPEGER